MRFALIAAVPADLAMHGSAIFVTPFMVEISVLPNQIDSVRSRSAAIVAAGVIIITAAGVMLADVWHIAAFSAFGPAVIFIVSG